MTARGQPTVGVPPDPHGQRCRHVDHVEAAVVRMGARSDVETPDVLDVHDRDDSPAPPAEAPGRRTTAWATAVISTPSASSRRTSRATRTTVSDGTGDPAVRKRSPPRTIIGRRLAALDRGRELRVTGQVNRSVRDGHHLAPRRRRVVIVTRRRSPRRPRTACRRRRCRGTRRSQPPAPGPGGRRRRDVADLAGEVDQLLHRADEVAAGQLLVANDGAEGVAGGPCHAPRRRIQDRAGGARPARSTARRRPDPHSRRRCCASASRPARSGTMAAPVARGCDARTRRSRAARQGPERRRRRRTRRRGTRRSADRISWNTLASIVPFLVSDHRSPPSPRCVRDT